MDDKLVEELKWWHSGEYMPSIDLFLKSGEVSENLKAEIQWCIDYSVVTGLTGRIPYLCEILENLNVHSSAT